jgi:aarF domain-containing kinase
MEYLPGVRLVDGVRAQYAALAKEQGTTLEAWEEQEKAKVKRGQARKLRSLEEDAKMIKLAKWALRTKDAVLNFPRLLLNWTVGFLFPKWIIPYHWSQLPLDLGKLLDTLMRVHAYEIFQNGSFNGDPHPGNILLMPDGRLGLIDYGQARYTHIWNISIRQT